MRTIVRLESKSSPGCTSTGRTIAWVHSSLPPGRPRCPARFTEQLYASPTRQPRFAWPPGVLTRTIIRILPGPQAAPRPEPEQFAPMPWRSTQKKARAAARAPIPRTIPRPRARGSPPPRENGVICPIMVLFIIFCYLTHII